MCVCVCVGGGAIFMSIWQNFSIVLFETSFPIRDIRINHAVLCV